MDDKIDAAELDKRKAAARQKAAAEHKPLATLDAAFSAYTKAVAAREAADKAEDAEDAADAELVAALRALEKARLGCFFRNSETLPLENRNPRLGLRLCGECYGGWNA